VAGYRLQVAGYKLAFGNSVLIIETVYFYVAIPRWDFDAFKASRAFVREVGRLVRTPSFAPNRNLVNQMERAAISVLSNFAEGYERDGNAEFIQFVSVSKGSVGKLRGQLIYSLDIGLIPESRYEELDTMGISTARLLGGLNRYLSGPERRGRKFDRRRKANL
jgi:four helix bundle protein